MERRMKENEERIKGVCVLFVETQMESQKIKDEINAKIVKSFSSGNIIDTIIGPKITEVLWIRIEIEERLLKECLQQ